MKVPNASKLGVSRKVDFNIKGTLFPFTQRFCGSTKLKKRQMGNVGEPRSQKALIILSPLPHPPPPPPPPPPPKKTKKTHTHAHRHATPALLKAQRIGNSQRRHEE